MSIKETTKQKSIKLKVINLLADYLGVDPSDLSGKDFLVEDLHMGPSDLSDFSEILLRTGLTTTDIDYSEIESVNDLVDFLPAEEDY